MPGSEDDRLAASEDRVSEAYSSNAAEDGEPNSSAILPNTEPRRTENGQQMGETNLAQLLPSSRSDLSNNGVSDSDASHSRASDADGGYFGDVGRRKSDEHDRNGTLMDAEQEKIEREATDDQRASDRVRPFSSVHEAEGTRSKTKSSVARYLSWTDEHFEPSSPNDSVSAVEDLHNENKEKQPENVEATAPPLAPTTDSLSYFKRKKSPGGKVKEEIADVAADGDRCHMSSTMSAPCWADETSFVGNRDDAQLELDTEFGMPHLPTPPYVEGSLSDEEDHAAANEDEGVLTEADGYVRFPSLLPPHNHSQSTISMQSTNGDVGRNVRVDSEVGHSQGRENGMFNIGLTDNRRNPAVLLQGYTLSDLGTEREQRRLNLVQVRRDDQTVYDGVTVPSAEETEANVMMHRSFTRRPWKNIIAAVVCIAMVTLVITLPVVHVLPPKNGQSDVSERLDIPPEFVDAVPSLLVTQDPRMISSPLPSVYPTSERPSVYPTSERFAFIKAVLSPSTRYTAAAFEDTASPQHRALVWLADEDERELDWWHVAGLMQRFALATLFFATGGADFWIEDCNFLSSEHECHWNMEVQEHGLGVSYKGALCIQDDVTVDTLVVPRNNVSGVLPDEISLLPGLEYLGLWGNRLSGLIPSTVRQLDKLQKLMLDENALSGTIPISLGALTELQVIFLHSNELSGPLPTSLGQLSKLTDLYLGSNHLSGTVSAELSNLSKLESLLLSSNSLSGTLPLSAGSFPNLQDLFMAINFFTGSIPSSVFTFQKLVNVFLGINDLTGTLSPEVGNLARLEMLEVGVNILSGTIPLSLMGLSQLHRLGLYKNEFSGTLPQEIGNMTKLQVLYLSRNHFEGTIPDSIGGLTELVELPLNGNQLSGRVPQSLAKLESLKILRLENNSISGDLRFLCDLSFVLFMADCHGDDPEVACECCNGCCSDELGPIGPAYDGCFAT